MQELEKILKELEEFTFEAEVYNGDFEGADINNLLCLGDVRDVLEKYMNDDWIPVEKRLPEEGQEVWISIKTDCVRRGMYTKRFGFGMREGFICSDGFADINAVNAWKLYIIPEPYRPKSKTPEEMQEWKIRMMQNFMRKSER